MAPRTAQYRLCGKLARLALLLVPGMLAPGAAAGADPSAAAPSARAILHLSDGSFAAGVLAESAKPGEVAWLADGFVSPFSIATGRLSAIHWPPPAVMPKPQGDFCFELAGGDVLFGSLVSLGESEAELDIPRLGRVHIERSALRRIYRWRESADLIYLGPNGSSGWHEVEAATAPAAQNGNAIVRGGPPRVVAAAAPAAAKPAWHEEAGQLETSQEGASIRGDFGIPARANIEFEISWKNKPDFVLALGTSEDDASFKRAFRFEVWDNSLVVQRELEKDGNLEIIQNVDPGAGRAHLQVYLDQQAGRILVFSQGGKQLASMQVGIAGMPVFPGIQLTNHRGDLRLEWLRIARWSGELPREVNADQSRVHRQDGSIMYGQVTAFDASSKEFVVQSESGKSRIAADKISSVFLSVGADETPRALRAVYQDSSRLSGALGHVDKGQLLFTVPHVKETLRLPVEGLRSLVMLKHADNTWVSKDSATGRLELEGVKLSGKLVDGSNQPGTTCLHFQPTASSTASAMKPGVSGRIVYRDPPPPQPAAQNIAMQRLEVGFNAPAQPIPPAGAANMVFRFAQALAEQPQSSGRSTEERRSLYLRDGDVIPSRITKIDEEGVWFKSSISTSTFVPHSKVKAIELSNEPRDARTIRLTRTKQERMLMLPRMQKADPPTHLIHSKDGDYLRGRVTGMDDKTLQVDLRLDSKAVPRDRISRIIWLHADELDESKKAPPGPPAANGSTRVQALRNDGVRLTFQAESFAGSSLSGKSEVLGPYQVGVKQIDQLLIGNEIDKVAAQLPYSQWKLKNAPEPKYVTASDAGGDGGSGVESALVGKAAPDFNVPLLGGGRFQLKQNTGKVVVLDFWATWCGPCLQSMPQVKRATSELKDQNVLLVAINLEETPEQVTAMLKRQQLELTVGLDRDGAVAAKYQAFEIPQTVIIDRKGNVARVFVGTGPHFDDQLREALKSVLAGEKAPEPKK